LLRARKPVSPTGSCGRGLSYDIVFFVIVAVLSVFFLVEIIRLFSGLLGLLQVMRAEIHRALNAAKRHV